MTKDMLSFHYEFNKMHSLVIIDMQPEFDASFDLRVQHRIIEEIKRTKKEKGDIIVLEYHGSGDTHEEITQAIGKYPKQAKVYKDEDAGGLHLYNVLANKRFPLHNLIVCGVNTEACVKHTVEEYLEYVPNRKDTVVHYLKRGCNTDWNEPFGKIIKRKKNIDVINN